MSSPHLDTKSAKGEKFLKRAEREACWCARDSFWECMRANDEDGTKCQAQRRKFEEMCPRTWVSHFDRKFEYLKFKDKLVTEGFQAADDQFQKDHEKKQQ